MVNKVKILLLALLLIFSLTACKAEQKQDSNLQQTPADSTKTTEYAPGEWITDYQQALKLSAETGYPILVNFTGSDWCIWCQKLRKEVFDEAAFTEYAKLNLVLLKLDFPKRIVQPEAEKKQNEELANRFGIEGFPTILLLDKDGKEIARTGYREGGAGMYVSHLKQLLSKK